MMTSQNGQREQFKALLRKNYTLKRRGLWCCSLFELLVPAAFVALMCLPKALVPDEKNHDVLYRPFSIGAGWNALGQFANTPEIDADGTAMSFSDTSFSEGALKGKWLAVYVFAKHGGRFKYLEKGVREFFMRG